MLPSTFAFTSNVFRRHVPSLPRQESTMIHVVIDNTRWSFNRNLLCGITKLQDIIKGNKTCIDYDPRKFGALIQFLRNGLANPTSEDYRYLYQACREMQIVDRLYPHIKDIHACELVASRVARHYTLFNGDPLCLFRDGDYAFEHESVNAVKTALHVTAIWRSLGQTPGGNDALLTNLRNEAGVIGLPSEWSPAEIRMVLDGPYGQMLNNPEYRQSIRRQIQDHVDFDYGLFKNVAQRRVIMEAVRYEYNIQARFTYCRLRPNSVVSTNLYCPFAFDTKRCLLREPGLHQGFPVIIFDEVNKFQCLQDLNKSRCIY